MHVPVLLEESIDGLNLEKGDVAVDATLGAGGHSAEIFRRFRNEVKIVGFDLDAEALDLAKAEVPSLIAIHANFRTMESALEGKKIGGADAILFDLGISSMEIGESGRGFSFQHDEPLLMTLQNPIEDGTLTAADVVNGESEEKLADIIYEFGEERFSRQIARAIVMSRKKARIETSGQLAEIVSGAVPGFYRKGRINPATKTFQALRIFVNDEMGAITEGLAGAWNVLKPGGRIAVITFHSMEDRIVKNFNKEKAKNGEGILITKKPIAPSRKEVVENRRSRSAKLRIIEKTI